MHKSRTVTEKETDKRYSFRDTNNICKNGTAQKESHRLKVKCHISFMSIHCRGRSVISEGSVCQWDAGEKLR